MRKPRDYDAELESLDQKAKLLRQRKISQLGELVIACGADALPIDVLAGALLTAAASDAPAKEVWRKAGMAIAVLQQRRPKRLLPTMRARQLCLPLPRQSARAAGLLKKPDVAVWRRNPFSGTCATGNFTDEA